MKGILAALLGCFLGAGPDVRFEAGGVRVGEGLVQGDVLTFRNTAQGQVLLASGSCVESLGGALAVALSADRTLILEPGVRIARGEKGFVLSTHGRRFVVLQAAAARVVLESPVPLALTARGWSLGGGELEGAELTARLQPQEPEKDLEAMQESARRIEEARKRRMSAPPKRRARNRRIFGEDPAVGAQAVDSSTVRFLPNVSPE